MSELKYCDLMRIENARERFWETNGGKEPTDPELMVFLLDEIDQCRETIKNNDFVEKAPETIKEEKTAPATGEILVNRDEYKKAVTKAIENAAKDPKLEGMASLMYSMFGACFASEVETILFKESEG